MNREQTDKIISEIDGKYVDEAACITQTGRTDAEGKVKGHPVRIRWGIIAACLLIAALIASTSIACAAEAKEYRDAIEFFDLNGLSAEGLTRTEIKGVYRDITTKKFTYSKTTDVIMKTVPGLDLQEDLSPEEIEENWTISTGKTAVYPGGISFRRTDSYHKRDSHNDEWDASVLECFENGALLWRAEFTNYEISGYWYSEGVTAVSGISGEWRDEKFYTSHYVALIDCEGNVIWEKLLDVLSSPINTVRILKSGDDTWAVIRRGLTYQPERQEYLLIEYYDSVGNSISAYKTEFDMGIRGVARLGDGFIISTWTYYPSFSSWLLYVDGEGNVLDKFSYETDDCYYLITDMAVFDGRLFLSGNAIYKQNLEENNAVATCIEDLLVQYTMSTSSWETFSSEELTRVIWEYSTAVLLMCEPENWQPKVFCSVYGSEAGLLLASNPDKLEWTVARISSTYFSPYTNSFTIGGTCRVIQYEFDTQGNLIARKDTGELLSFRR